MAEEDPQLAEPAADQPGKGGAPGGEYPGMPRWVKVFGLIVIGLVLLAVVMLVVTTALGIHTPPVSH